MHSAKDRSIHLDGQLAEDLTREAAALQIDPQRLVAAIVRAYILALRQGRHEVTAAGRQLGRSTGTRQEGVP